MKKISIITVVYNGAKELQATIDSVSAQNYPFLEYIIIDGGSTDTTLEIIKKNSAYVHKWVSNSDKGIYDAMNKGISFASGEFVIFMNSGDTFYASDVISRCFASDEANQSDIVYGDHWLLGSRRHDGYHIAKDVNQLPHGMICCHQSMFFRRQCLLTQPFSLQFGTAGDYEAICRLYKSGATFFRCTGVIIAYYRAGGVSDIRRSRSIKNAYRASSRYFDLGIKAKCTYFFRLLRAYMVDCYAYCFNKR